MATKKKSSVEHALSIFEDVMNRADLTDYFHVNRILLSKNPKDNTILIPVDQILWNTLIDKPEFKSHLQELDIKDETNIKKSSYANDLNSENWIDLDCQLLYEGKLLKINIEGLDYEININKALIPLKLKKSEFVDIKYRVFRDGMILAIKKTFNYPLEECGFSVIRLLQIV